MRIKKAGRTFFHDECRCDGATPVVELRLRIFISAVGLHSTSGNDTHVRRSTPNNVRPICTNTLGEIYAHAALISPENHLADREAQGNIG
jgi:hypothetical protein